MQQTYHISKLILLIIWLGLGEVQAQKSTEANPTLDSLRAILKQKDLSPQQKVDVYNEIAFEYVFLSYDTSIKYLKEAEIIANKIKYDIGRAQSQNITGVILRLQGNYSKALEAHFEALKICENKDYLQGKANNYSNIGLVYSDKNDYEQALTYFQKALKIKRKLNDRRGIAFTLNDIGNVYFNKKEYVASMQSYEQAISIRRKINDSQGTAGSYNSIGRIYLTQGNYQEALSNLEKALSIGEKFDDHTVMSNTLNNIAEVYYRQNDYNEALNFFQKAINSAEGIDLKMEMRTAYEGMAKTLARLGKYQEAYSFLEKYIRIKEALFNEENNRRIASLQLSYEIEKKDREIMMLNTKQKQKDKELKWQTLLRNIFIGGFALIIIFAFVLYRANKAKNKANLLLTEQKQEIETQNEALEYAFEEIKRQNDQITQSINAAQKIQEAILPFNETLSQAFSNFFLLYKPRDIVSGDFYWFSQIKDTKFVAVIDCTGHGVPGAFMSMIGSSLLNKIVNEDDVHEPSKIMDKLHEGVRIRLKQEYSQNNDGMDVCLCRIRPEGEQTEIVYTGAKRPLYIARKQEALQVLKGDRKSVGGTIREDDYKFSQERVLLDKGTWLYLSTDGYADQNNQKRKKFGRKRLIECLEKIKMLKGVEQKQTLNQELTQHQEGTPQRDDILLLGFSV